METSLSIKNENNEFHMLQVISKNAAGSGLYSGVGSEAKIFMILLAAKEIGIPPMQALNGGIWNIQGKIEISARLMSGMIRRAGHSIKVVQCDSNKCILEGKRGDNGDCCTSQFTMEDAIKAGLANRDVWKKYTEDMLYARAMSRLARRLYSDVIGTAYVEGEISDGNVEIISSEIVKQPEEDVKQPEEDVKQSEEDIKEIERIVKERKKVLSDRKKEIKNKIGEENVEMMIEYIKLLKSSYPNKTEEEFFLTETVDKFVEAFEFWKNKQARAV